MAELSREKFETVGKDLSKSQSVVRPSMTYWQDAWRRLKSNKLAMASLILLLLLAVLAIVGPWMRPFVYDQGDLMEMNKTPNGTYWFGTDELGRDLWVRVWKGARISLYIGLAVAFVNLTISIVYGGIAGYVGGTLDDIMMRIIEIITSVPYLLWAIMLMTIFDQSVTTIIIALTIVGWANSARLVRGQILQLREMEFVLAAKSLGANLKRLLFRHLVPNTMGVLIIRITFTIPVAIFGEAFLSYIGMGVPVPEPSLGGLAREGTRMILVHPYQLFVPSVVISLIMLAFNLFGDGLRDALDPKLRQ